MLSPINVGGKFVLAPFFFIASKVPVVTASSPYQLQPNVNSLSCILISSTTLAMMGIMLFAALFLLNIVRATNAEMLQCAAAVKKKVTSFRGFFFS